MSDTWRDHASERDDVVEAITADVADGRTVVVMHEEAEAWLT